MPNYYELLKIQPTATLTEIETACEDQYNQWRRLVTHHDPTIVNQANQSLLALESIRSVLTDPAKRSVYDAGIGISGPVGGLADPEALLRAGTPLTPPAPASVPPSAPVAPTTRIDAWVCVKCRKPNAIGTRFCNQCGAEVGKECPKCNKITEASGRFCAHCGTHMTKFVEEKRYAAQSFDAEIDLAKRWIAEVEMTKGNYRFSPVLETRIAIGSFADVFERCCNAAERFRYHQPLTLGLIAPATKIKQIDAQGGHIECSLGGSGMYLMNRWSLHLFVQQNSVQHRGVMIVCTYYIPNLVTYTSDIAKQAWEALAQAGLRFTA